MSVRRRMVKDRLERDRKWTAEWDAFGKSLDALKRVVDKAIAEGLTTLTQEEFAKRLAHETGGKQ